MYEVQWIEDGKENKKRFEDRDEAFLFQSGVLARRKFDEKGNANIVAKGVWRV